MISRLDVDDNRDGRVETRTYMVDGRPARIEIDLDDDGRVDRWEYYDAEGKLERLGAASQRDGVEDTWVVDRLARSRDARRGTFIPAGGLHGATLRSRWDGFALVVRPADRDWSPAVVRALEPLIDGAALADLGIYCQPAALPLETCRRIRAGMDAGEHAPAQVADGGFVTDVRIRDALDVDIAPALLSLVEGVIADARPAIAGFFSVRLSSSEGTGLVRYGEGVGYRRHRDVGPGLRRRVAVVIFLNSAGTGGDFKGGHLRFYPGERAAFEVVPAAGALIAFAADRVHEVLPIAAGVRDVAVDWYY